MIDERTVVRRDRWRYVLPIAAVLLVWLGVAAPAADSLARSGSAAAVSGRLPGVAHQPAGVVTHEATASGRIFLATAERANPLLGTRCAACAPAAAGHPDGRGGHYQLTAQSHRAGDRSRAPPPVHE